MGRPFNKSFQRRLSKKGNDDGQKETKHKQGSKRRDKAENNMPSSTDGSNASA